MWISVKLVAFEDVLFPVGLVSISRCAAQTQQKPAAAWPPMPDVIGDAINKKEKFFQCLSAADSKILKNTPQFRTGEKPAKISDDAERIWQAAPPKAGKTKRDLQNRPFSLSLFPDRNNQLQMQLLNPLEFLQPLLETVMPKFEKPSRQSAFNFDRPQIGSPDFPKRDAQLLPQQFGSNQRLQQQPSAPFYPPQFDSKQPLQQQPAPPFYPPQNGYQPNNEYLRYLQQSLPQFPRWQGYDQRPEQNSQQMLQRLLPWYSSQQPSEQSPQQPKQQLPLQNNNQPQLPQQNPQQPPPLSPQAPQQRIEQPRQQNPQQPPQLPQQPPQQNQQQPPQQNPQQSPQQTPPQPLEQPPQQPQQLISKLLPKQIPKQLLPQPPEQPPADNGQPSAPTFAPLSPTPLQQSPQPIPLQLPSQSPSPSAPAEPVPQPQNPATADADQDVR